MNLFRWLLLAAAVVRTGLPANLAVATYLKDGFTPTAIASDTQGDIYLAGSAVTDAAAQTTGAVVARIDPKATQYLYLTYLDSAAADQVSAIVVDAAGNAYVAGSTTNANFPAVGGGTLGTPPASATDSRSFVTKLNPDGAVVFSVLIGGSTMSTASGIALTPQGQILVSGIAGSSGFPATAGAYSVSDSTNQWFLMELDPTASKMIFSATGIGGSSLVLDSVGNIYMAGSSIGTTYPTTPSAYQTTFVQGSYCFGLCQISFQGGLQHVTKVDPAASKLIYSTGLNNTAGLAGSTTNTGLAVDSAGDAYVTGTLFQAQYPFTVAPPSVTPASSYGTYLTKLDPAGASVLYSLPIGGGGVQLDSSGALYVGGVISGLNLLLTATQVTLPPVFSWIPQLCAPNNVTAIQEAYVMKLEPATGNAQDGQWIDGSGAGAVGITLAGSQVWITGTTPASDVPFTPGVLAPANLGPGFLEGAYLAAADFSTGVNTGPAIACVLDSGNLTHVRSITSFQLISIFGANLGPTTGVTAPNGTAASLGGVSAAFLSNGGQILPAQLLYVSSSQINLEVPSPSLAGGVPAPTSMVLAVTVNGKLLERQFPFTSSNLNVFANLSSNSITCPAIGYPVAGAQPLAMNADGSLNSCAHPAHYGSTVSFFLHGIGGFANPFTSQPFSGLLNLQATVGSCSAAVTNTSLIDDFVYQVQVALPTALDPCDADYSNGTGENYFPVTFSYNDLPVGPLMVPGDLAGPLTSFAAPGQPMALIVWVAP